MYKIVEETIFHTRGDSLYAHVTLKNRDGTEYVPQEGDAIRFALKRKYADATPLILKPIPTDTLILHLEPSDTKPFDFGKYVYDVEVEKVNGDVITIIPKDPEKEAVFNLCKEVY